MFGVRAKSPRPRATETAVHAPPSARALRGKRVSVSEWRKGFSTRRLVTTAGTYEAARTPMPSSGDSDPQIAAAKTSGGQCQRYHEEEIRPTCFTGPRVSTRAAPAEVVANPAAMIAAVPRVGTSAA